MVVLPCLVSGNTSRKSDSDSQNKHHTTFDLHVNVFNQLSLLSTSPLTFKGLSNSFFLMVTLSRHLPSANCHLLAPSRKHLFPGAVLQVEMVHTQ